MPKKGFTLIELLVVVAVLGVLATVAMVRLTGPERGARDSRRQSDLKQYQTSLEVYANRNNGLYPIVNGAAHTVLCAPLGLSGCPTDPQGTNPYQYQSNAGGTTYVLYALLERPVGGVAVNYVSCSNGKNGTVAVTTNIANGVCPLP